MPPPIGDDLLPLPSPPRAAASSPRQRATGERRSRIDQEVERTVVGGEEAAAVADAPELQPGTNLVVARQVMTAQGPRSVEERFVIAERLSSERNIAGDVFRAVRTWGGELYGDVVLKKPKSSLRASEQEYWRVCRDLEREQRFLVRFEELPGLVSPAGRPFLLDGELVLQTRYLPWSVEEYLGCFSDEHALTAAMAGLACQCLGTIEHLARSRDAEAPAGYAHVDLKTTHMRVDDHERADGTGEWRLVIIDLDSVLPVGPVPLAEAKYNRACVDPEKFMALHDRSQLCTVAPEETVYAMALTLLRLLADGMGLPLERRRVQPVGLASGPKGALLTGEEALRREIERIRALDRRNLSSAYWVNRERRLQAGHPDRPLPMLEASLDEETTDLPALLPTARPPSWCVRPDFFLCLQECLRPRAERLDPGRLRALFARLPGRE